jgi:bifunctional non-homologous end joining protein LigD
VKTGRTNDEVAADPDAEWTREGEKTLKRSSDPPTDDELAALEALGPKGTWVFQGRELRLTNLDKVLFPSGEDERPVTKRELIRYHALIASTMLPYLADRPVNMHRYPNGVDKSGFWHKELPSHAPDWITRWHNDDAAPDETQWYAVIDNPPALAWMANYGAVELHPWTSRIPDVHNPTWAFIDIDPGPKNSFDDVITLAHLYHTALDHMGVEGMPKVTGQRGIQVWVPIEPIYSFDQTREWVGEVSKAIGNTVPDLVSWAWEKKARKGLARLDYTQNAINKTLVAPYSARPAPGAPVSVPVEWDELDDPDLRADGWTIATVPGRLAARSDPWATMSRHARSLPSRQDRLARLVRDAT